MTSIPISPNNDKYKSVDHDEGTELTSKKANNKDINNNQAKNNNNNKPNTKPQNQNSSNRTCSEALQASAFALPAVVALLVIVVSVLVITLMSINTDKAVATVVDSLQDQVLALADSRFEQQLSTYMQITNATAGELLRLALPQPPNDVNPMTIDGFDSMVEIFDRNAHAFEGVDTSLIIYPSGRMVGVAPQAGSSTVSFFFYEDWDGAFPVTYFFSFPAKNVTSLKTVSISDNIFVGRGLTGSRRDFWNAVNRSEPNAYAWTPPSRVPGSTLSVMSIVTTMFFDNGTFYGLCATSIELASLQSFFKNLKPTPRTIVYVLEPENSEVLVASSAGDTILDDQGNRRSIKESNITVLAAAGRAIPDYRTVKGPTRATFKAAGEQWRLTAKPFTAYGNNFVLAVATPDDEFSGEVDKATRNTIIICVVVTVVVIALIIFLSIQQHRLVQSSEQSVLVAKAVSSHLLVYDTDSAEQTLNAASKPTFVNQETGSEQNNYVNQNLINTLRQIVENLMLYRPHLPEYVLPQKPTTEESAEVPDDLMNDDDESINLYSSNNSPGASKDDSLHRNNSSSHRMSRSANSDFMHHQSNPANPFYVVQKTSPDGDTSSHISGSTAKSNKAGKTQIARVAMLRDSGSYVERVILGTLNLSRIPEIVFPLSQGVKGATVRYINRVIELILDNASHNDATVHSLVGDSLQVSWNGTQRTAHADVKACRFVTKTEVALKKEITEWLKDPLFQKGVVPIFNTRRALLTGGLAHGAAWCQLGGSNTKQQFMMLNFSEQLRMQTAFELGIKYKFVSVCHVMNQNVQHEFLLRGAGLNVLPGGHIALFGGSTANTQGFINSVNNTSGVVALESVSNNSTGDHPSDPSAPSSAATGGEEDTNTSTNNNYNTGGRRQSRGDGLGQGAPTSPTVPPLQNDGKTFLAMPIFELVSRKKLDTNEDEWLYVVGDGNNANDKTAQTQVCAALSDAVMALCRGNAEKATACLEKAKRADENCVGLGAFQSLQQLVNAVNNKQG